VEDKLFQDYDISKFLPFYFPFSSSSSSSSSSSYHHLLNPPHAPFLSPKIISAKISHFFFHSLPKNHERGFSLPSHEPPTQSFQLYLPNSSTNAKKKQFLRVFT